MLYELETWVTKLCIGRVLGKLHHREARRLMGKQHWRGWDGGWLHPTMENTMAEAGLQEVETYLSRHHNTVTQFIASRPIMDLCLAVELSPG